MEIFKHLQPDTTILTPNRRLSAKLLEYYNQEQLKQGNHAWQTLDILPYQTWIQRIWDEVAITFMNNTHAILSSHQELILWENIIKQSPGNDSLLQLSGTAELAKSACGTLKQWQVDIHHPLLGLTEDSQNFQQWAMTFEELCQKHRWLTLQSLEHSIIKHIAQRHIKLSHAILIVGFTELTPIQRTLFQQCEDIGCEINFIDHLYPFIENKSYFLGLADHEAELTVMARWAKQLLNEQPTESLTIGCIIPNLEKNRDRVAQIFSDVLTQHEFNISAGKSLISYPIIHAALEILALTNLMTIDKMRFLLRTPFIGEAEAEYTKRAKFEAKLQQDNIQVIRLNACQKLAIEKHCPHLAKRLKDLISSQDNSMHPALPSEHVNDFIERLSIMGWPGERSINSQEYQIVQRFLDLLNEYQSYDHVLQEVTYSNAIEHLQQLATNTIFQPQSKQTPVQILGLLEAANMPFDYAWIAGLDDSAWPPPAKPNPFIPHKLQKSLQMPHATAEKELAYSTKLTVQFKQSTQNLIFSYALKSGDCDLRPSALITNGQEIVLETIQQASIKKPADIIFEHQTLESLHDEQAPRVTELETIHGGVNILKQQAACAFKAFAEIRLHARHIEPICIGLRPQERGVITHKALELLWKQIQDYETLIHLDEEQLNQIIESSAAQAIEFVTQQSTCELRYLALEWERLTKLLNEWVLLEKKRLPFKVISQEEERHLTIGILPLALRVDRIDELENGDHLVIDYKTGKYNSIKYWFSDRPDEPQLPLYCLSDPDKIKALGFAEIHPDKLSLLGISASAQELDKIKPLSDVLQDKIITWQEQIESWKTIFATLANEFTQGNAEISPKHKIETCQYCELKPLCRIHEYQAELT